ncbi:MAG TPA: YceI family protein [Actinophytocola sp.]|uniref:YceI family protein n=1 Tax=Actinophytocola sp. TaxID=1872138 RepID=UPI002DDD3DB2|nr:YceI family protein [Actinophytocola sp.]HEV2779217.1 YceI family protein [Actinophytocola sp.]
MSSPTTVEIPGYIAGTWDFDPAHTYVGFVVRHLVVTKVRGRFETVEGHIHTAENPLDSTVEVSVDLNSVNTNNETRDNHLRSADFFEVEKYPRMTFRSTGIRPDGDAFVLDGELTIKDVTRPVSLNFELSGFGKDPWGGTRLGLEAKGEINRKDFNVNFEGVQDGIAVVADKIELVIDVEAVLRKDDAPAES